MQPVPSLAWTRAEWITLAAILGLGALLRIACAVAVPSPLESDYLEYWVMANNLHAGRGLAGADGQPTAFFSPGYPLFLTGAFTAFGPTIAAVKGANAALGVASILLTYLATRRLFGSWTVAALAALMLAVYAEAIVYTAYVAKENLMVFLVTAQLALAVTQVGSRPQYVSAILFGIATGCMAMVGNAGLVLVPALVICIYAANRSGAKTMRYLALAALTGGLVVAPLLQRNHEVFGSYTLNNNGGFNLYIGNNPSAGPYFTSIADTPIGGEWHQLRATLGERGADVTLRGLAIQHIMQNPGATLGLALHKAAVFWTPPWHAGKYQQGTAETLMRLAWLVEFCVIVALFLASAARLRALGWRLGVLWLLMASYTAVHMIFYVIYRYRLPIMPVLCVGAALSAQSMLSWSARHWLARVRGRREGLMSGS